MPFASLSLMTAMSKLEKSLDMDPEYAEAHVATARVYLKLRDFSGLRKQDRYEEYMSLARLNALEDRSYEAMLELEHFLSSGGIDPRDLLHPAFDDMRNEPEFKQLEELQRQRINSERIRLGLVPLSFSEQEPEMRSTQTAKRFGLRLSIRPYTSGWQVK